MIFWPDFYHIRDEINFDPEMPTYRGFDIYIFLKRNEYHKYESLSQNKAQDWIILQSDQEIRDQSARL